MRRAGALAALLCAGIFGVLVLNWSLSVLAICGGALVVAAMLREMWSSERAYRRDENARDDHFLKEREHANTRRRERGD